MTNKEIYTIWAARQTTLPIFMQPWWMDCVCAGKTWDVFLFFANDVSPDAIAADEDYLDSNLLAAMPYLIGERLKMKYVLMPQETQIGGLWVNEKKRDDFQQNNDILATVYNFFVKKISALNLYYYYQQFPINSPIIPWIDKRDFKIKKRITYRIEAIEDLDMLIENFSKNIKRQLHKSLSLRIDWSVEPEQFYAFHTQSMLQRKKKLAYSREFFLVLQQKVCKYEQGCILSIKNQENTILAAAFLVWDSVSLYYLIPAYDPQHKNSGASALLVLEAIKLAQRKKLIFDFEGSMNSNIAKFYKQFASVPTTYYSVERVYKPIFKLALLYNWLRNRKF